MAFHHVPPTTLTISTEQLSERDRVPVWREFVGRQLMNLEIEPFPDTPFVSGGTLRMLPEVDVFFGHSTGAHYRTTREVIGNDDIALVIGGAPQWRAWQMGREAMLSAGDAVLTSNSEVGGMVNTRPGDEQSGASSTLSSLCLRRSSLVRLVPDIEAALVKPIRAGSAPLRLLNAYLKILDEPDVLSSTDARQLASTHIHDLVALAAGATRDAAQLAANRGGRAARLLAAKAIVARELDNPRLGVGDVALRLGVTPRTVQMLFESEGTTFSLHLLQHRLQRVHRLLCDPRCAHHSISDLAFDAGFGGLAHFNRSFRRQFGATPSEVRAAARR